MPNSSLITPYKEGSVFAVPLRSSGYGVGLVARSAPKGKIILAYFFNHFFKRVPNEEDIVALARTRAFKCLRVGDLGLITGAWPLIGHLKGWRAEDWPVPRFIRREPLSKRAWICIYDDRDPSKLIDEISVPSDTSGFEEDMLYGTGVVEVLLTNRFTTSGKHS